MSLERELINKYSSDTLLSFCPLEDCKGLPLNIDYEGIIREVECPVCYVSLNSGKVSLLIKCNHMFCSNCIKDWDNK